MTQEATKYEGQERRNTSTRLSDEQIAIIAEKAAEVALQKVYTNIGKSVVSKFLWVIGAGTLAVAAWMNGAGHLPVGK